VTLHQQKHIVQQQTELTQRELAHLQTELTHLQGAERGKIAVEKVVEKVVKMPGPERFAHAPGIFQGLRPHSSSTRQVCFKAQDLITVAWCKA